MSNAIASRHDASTPPTRPKGGIAVFVTSRESEAGKTYFSSPDRSRVRGRRLTWQRLPQVVRVTGPHTRISSGRRLLVALAYRGPHLRLLPSIPRRSPT